MKTQTLTLLLALALLTLPAPAPAQWTNDPWNGMVEVCMAPGLQVYAKMCLLDGGKSLIAWNDERTDSMQLYYQILDPSGIPLLQNDGILVAGNSISFWYSNVTSLIPEGFGGCVAAFSDNRSGHSDVYGQRFDSFGNKLWGETGLPLATSTVEMICTDLVKDSLGNFFIGYMVNWSPFDTDFYVQKFNASGQRLWGDGGAPAAVAPNRQTWGKLVPDAQGGVYIMWADDRDIPYVTWAYAQHLNTNGNALWQVNGVPLQDPGTGQPVSVDAAGVAGGIPDAAGSIWSYSTYWNWFLMRLGDDGRVIWNDMYWVGDVCLPGPPIRHPADSSIWVATTEARGGISGGYLYRFASSGEPLFGTTGLNQVEDGALVQNLIPTNDGIINLIHYRLEEDSTFYLKGRRIDSTGTLIWQTDVAICYGGGTYGPACFSDGFGGVVISWDNGMDYPPTRQNIFAQHLSGDGTLGDPISPVPPIKIRDIPKRELAVYGNAIYFQLSNPAEIQLNLYDLLGRKVMEVQSGYLGIGEHRIPFDSEGLASGIYILRLSTAHEIQTVKINIVK